MVELVRVNFGIKLSQLIIHISSLSVVLDIEIAVSKEGKSSAVTRTELHFVCQNVNDLQINS